MNQRTPIKNVFAFALAMGICIVFWNCSGGWDWPTPQRSPDASASIQILGHAYDAVGNPAKILSVTAFPVEYHAPLPYSQDSGITRQPSAGNITNNTFEFLGLDSGSYNILAEDSLGNKCLVESLSISWGNQSQPACTLRATGSLFGIATDSLEVLPESSFVYVQGTAFSSYVLNHSGQFNLHGLPSGTFTIKGQSYPNAHGMVSDTHRVFMNSMITSADYQEGLLPTTTPPLPAGSEMELTIISGDTVYVRTVLK